MGNRCSRCVQLQTAVPKDPDSFVKAEANPVSPRREAIGLPGSAGKRKRKKHDGDYLEKSSFSFYLRLFVRSLDGTRGKISAEAICDNKATRLTILKLADEQVFQMGNAHSPLYLRGGLSEGCPCLTREPPSDRLHTISRRSSLYIQLGPYQVRFTY